MADISFIKLLPMQAVNHYIRLKSVTSKIQRTILSIAFMWKALYYEVTPTFAEVKSLFFNLKVSVLSNRRYYILISNNLFQSGDSATARKNQTTYV